MKILIDMNLSPAWRSVLEQHGWEAVHCSEVGEPRATDTTIMDWATAGRWAVLTHDLDFGALLAATGARGPSVIQVRAQDVLPSHLAPLVVDVLTRFRELIEEGALIVVDEAHLRVRVLPLARSPR